MDACGNLFKGDLGVLSMGAKFQIDGKGTDQYDENKMNLLKV